MQSELLEVLETAYSVELKRIYRVLPLSDKYRFALQVQNVSRDGMQRSHRRYSNLPRAGAQPLQFNVLQKILVL
jgi:hypothetical protein